MPLLEHLDVTVVDERPYEIAAPDGRPRWIYSFGVRADGAVIRSAIPTCRPASPRSSSACGRARIENDGLNRLVLRAGLASREIVIVRALCQYLRQAGVRFTDTYLADTLAANPDAVRQLVALFHHRLDPARARPATDTRRGRTARRRARARHRRGRQPRRRPDPPRAVAAGRARSFARTRTAASRTWR